LVYFAAFYSVTLVGHWLAGRREELRADFLTGCFNLIAIAPFLVPFLFGLGSLSVPYWQSSDISLPGIVVEQFLFLGTTLPYGGKSATAVNLLVFGLLLAPLVSALRRQSRLIRAEPALSSLWWVAPGIVAAAGLLVGQDLLFYPRGFIPSAPFLLAYWVLFTGAMTVRTWVRGIYVAVLLVPFCLSGYLVAASHPSQAYLRGQDKLAEVVRHLEVYRDDFDILLVHHWWMAPYFAYNYPDRSRVMALGRDYRDEGGVLRDLERVPPESRVLLVLNDVATKHTDPEGKVVAALMAKRSLIREIPCPNEALLGRGLLCDRILLFSRE
jgi:hypothetical protein